VVTWRDAICWVNKSNIQRSYWPIRNLKCICIHAALHSATDTYYKYSISHNKIRIISGIMLNVCMSSRYKYNTSTRYTLSDHVLQSAGWINTNTTFMINNHIYHIGKTNIFQLWYHTFITVYESYDNHRVYIESIYRKYRPTTQHRVNWWHARIYGTPLDIIGQNRCIGVTWTSV